MFNAHKVGAAQVCPPSWWWPNPASLIDIYIYIYIYIYAHALQKGVCPFDNMYIYNVILYDVHMLQQLTKNQNIVIT